MKGMSERIDESVFWCFGHIEKLKNSRTAKRVNDRECMGNRQAGRPRNRWIDSTNERLLEKEEACM